MKTDYMAQKYSDDELLKELTDRFNAHKKTLENQKILIGQLNSVSEKLLFSELLKTNFLSNIRNEINNPITAILELSKSIADGNMSIEKIKKFAMLIHNEVSVLDFQLRNILCSAEIEAGESHPTIQPVKVSALINNIIGAFKNHSDKKFLSVKFNDGTDPETVFYTDSEKLHLIISNLFSNAIQYNRTGGNIEIDCNIIDDQLNLSVQDTGIGISEENRNKIYDRFRQLELGSAKTYGGHGLGLSVTKTLLELLNGEIEIESSEGTGTRFSIKLTAFEKQGSMNNLFSEDGNDFFFNENEGMSF